MRKPNQVGWRSLCGDNIISIGGNVEDLHETNNCASLNNIPVKETFTIQELMIFLGILFCMEITVKLLNLLKVTGGKYIDFGRHLIVYNPRKPTGYHFKMYMLRCASAWVAVNFISGDYCHGVSVEHHMLVVSFCDGNIVRVVSNITMLVVHLAGACNFVRTTQGRTQESR
ncbi:Transposase putative [Phytophthora palmivora]|uniref:Transposase putative n=1 Tax=Phytophthora palmivora TaxID=4796 RepID=A0A2P4Y8R9_9STRA|nr:Transposase putative [Phytophthora palmivora]